MKHLNMSNADYHAAEGISKSGLDLIARSPAHYRYAPSREPTRAMVLGTATHCAILEPAEFSKRFVVLTGVDDRRSSIYKEAVKARSEDEVLTGTEGDRIAGMAESVRGNPEAAALLGLPGHAEVSIFATDPVTGVKVKIRPDWLTDCGRMVDLKTAGDASDEAFGKSVANYRYYVQQAFYMDVFQWAFGTEAAGFDFLVAESDAPYNSTVVALPDDVVEYGRKVYRRDLNRYADCLMRDEWPGIPGGRHILAMPGWFCAKMDSETTEDII